MALLTLGALGVVYGDIGTSPLYALRECFNGSHSVPATPENILGILSLILWALLIIVSLKYVMFVMRADNRGEGGVLALMTLLVPSRYADIKSLRRYLELLALFGAALIYGDGIITPAISVLSAVEGLQIATPRFEPYVVGITIIILCGIFFVQRHGTDRVGKIFGPIILLWFLTLAVLGISGILRDPRVFQAINPLLGLGFVFHSGLTGMFVLGAVFLAVTGAEALYADMGHFGKTPIRIGWFGIVLPSLLLNYFGQGALLMQDPSAIVSPFYLLAPSWLLIPFLVPLATLAAIIASQAMISGTFSMTRQAVQLGYLPRTHIQHTSAHEIGQIYVPILNNTMLVLTILLVLGFRTSGNLAAAYGIAVSLTMVITTILVFFVAVERWRWNQWVAIAVAALLLAVDLTFLAANLLKVAHGGWITLLFAVIVFILMTTWRKGRHILGNVLQELTPPFTDFLAKIKRDTSIRVPGTAVFMTRNIERTPPALIHNVKHNKIIHKTVMLLMVSTEEQPHVPDIERISVDDLGDGFFSVTVRYGFMETPDISGVIEQLGQSRFDFKLGDVTFFLGRETLLATDQPGMAIWREKLFAVMSQNAQRATTFFKIPPEQVIEIGFQVKI